MMSIKVSYVFASLMIGLVFSAVMAQSVSPTWVQQRTKRTPWIDVSHQAQIQDREIGKAPEVSNGRVSVLLSDGAEIEFISGSSNRSTMARWRSGEEADWTQLVPQAAAMQGKILDGQQGEDGRIFLLLHDQFKGSPTEGDLVLWVGQSHQIQQFGEGLFTVRLAALQGEEPIWGRLELSDDGKMHIETIMLSQRAQVKEVLTQISLDQIDQLVPSRGYRLPLVDLDDQSHRHVVVDREKDQYLGHPTTVLLEDGQTLLCVYPKGHGSGAIIYKRSTDGGRSWSDRLPVPENWSSSKEVPTLYRVVDPRTGKKRLIMWSGLYPARLAVSEDDGHSWSPLEPISSVKDETPSPWGGIVVMACVEQLNDGRYMAMFHDDGRYIKEDGVLESPVKFSLYKTLSSDGGLTWSYPEAILEASDVHLCEPGLIRSPDGKTIAILLRENSRVRNSYVMFSEDEGLTWSPPRELPAALTGDRHQGVYVPDGRLFISFRDTTLDSPTKGDWVAWVGTWEDILYGTPGQYRVRIKDNKNRWDAAYPGVVVQPDGTIVTTTYGHWDTGEKPYILSSRMNMKELDKLAQEVDSNRGLNSHTQ